MSWLAPKQIDDVGRVLRGIALVVTQAAAGSRVVQHAVLQNHLRGARPSQPLATQQHEPVSTGDADPHADSPAGKATMNAVASNAPQQRGHTAATASGSPQQDFARTATAAMRSKALPTSVAASNITGTRRQASAGPSTAQPQAATGAVPALHPSPGEQADEASYVLPGTQAMLLQRPPPVHLYAPSSRGNGVSPAEEELPVPEPPLASTGDPLSVTASSSAQPAEGIGHPYPPSTDLGPASADNDKNVGWPSPHDDLVAQAAQHSSQGEPEASNSRTAAAAGPSKLRERRVPSSPLGRAFGFATMGARLALGTLQDNIVRTLSPSLVPQSAGAGGAGPASSRFVTEQNAERLAEALCRMRGAALKLGQMLSLQDEDVLPPQVLAALARVRQGADVMPRWQLEKVLREELGGGWRERVAEFEEVPRAAASIGQVHFAQLHDGRQVAMKIQYPGVARSIESDVDNLMRLIRLTGLLPPGLYAERAAAVAKRELALECDYANEATAQQRFASLVSADEDLSRRCSVPAVVPQLSSARVLTSEWVRGVPIDKVREMPQAVRDEVGGVLLLLTLRELFQWRFMQTDPNWGNFLYNQHQQRLHLIDFGAARDYPPAFVSHYLRMVRACADRDRQAVIDSSVRLGFLTGDESEVMLDAHCEAGFIVGRPFASSGLYDFGLHSGMTARVGELGAVMLRHRLTPPPEESYSLHRKLSGAFLACMKLRARVPCRDMLLETWRKHAFVA